jgi:hypothetical protein
MPRNQELQSTEKRDPGFVKLRRGLRPHLAKMSSNSVKLYVELLLRADWKGPKRGWVETSYEDVANSLRWSLKTLQRAVEELTGKPYIEVERAANQYELTRIKILKYDLEECPSGVDKSVQSYGVGVDRAVDSGVDKSVQRSVHTSATISQSHKDLQAPKKVKKYRSKEKDLTPLPP